MNLQQLSGMCKLDALMCLREGQLDMNGAENGVNSNTGAVPVSCYQWHCQSCTLPSRPTPIATTIAHDVPGLLAATPAV